MDHVGPAGPWGGRWALSRGRFASTLAAMLTPARRVQAMEDVTQPGDYWRGDMVVHADGTMCDTVLFLLPPADGIPEWAHGLHQVHQPPHVFRECPDGSLEIRASIGCGGGDGFYWHGYLDEGNVWRQV